MSNNKTNQIIQLNQKLCVDCGWCLSYCRFSALILDNEDKFNIIPENCCGCGECIEGCPRNALLL